MTLCATAAAALLVILLPLIIYHVETRQAIAEEEGRND